MEVPSSLVHRLFYPQVPLVLAAQSGKRFSAMPVVSYASVSDTPPLVAVSCNPKGFTCKLAMKARAFSLSVLDADRVRSVSSLASTSGAKTDDKLRAAGLAHSPGRSLKVPCIDGAEATLELTLNSHRRLGDHTLLVGKVEAAYSSRAFDGYWDFRQYTPMLYTGWKDGMTTYNPAE